MLIWHERIAERQRRTEKRLANAPPKTMSNAFDRDDCFSIADNRVALSLE
jgi:hypothetical protein